MNDFDDMVYQAGRAKVQIRRQGKPTEITLMEAMVGKQHEAGLKGSVVAQKDALQAFARASERKAADARLNLSAGASSNRNRKHGLLRPRRSVCPQRISCRTQMTSCLVVRKACVSSGR